MCGCLCKYVTYLRGVGHILVSRHTELITDHFTEKKFFFENSCVTHLGGIGHTLDFSPGSHIGFFTQLTYWFLKPICDLPLVTYMWELEGVYELGTFAWTTRYLCVAFLLACGVMRIRRGGEGRGSVGERDLCQNHPHVARTSLGSRRRRKGPNFAISIQVLFLLCLAACRHPQLAASRNCGITFHPLSIDGREKIQRLGLEDLPVF